MASRPSSIPPRAKSGTPGRGIRLVAAVAFAMLLVVVVYVVRSQGDGTRSGPRRPFDPTMTNQDELRRVTEGVSRIIAAPRDQHEAAVETLESLRVQSPGARDLQESCVNTYRPPLRAAQIHAQLSGMLLLPDGGEARLAGLPPEQLPRVQHLVTEAEEQIDLAHSSEDRCYELYGEAVRMLHLAPAQRPTPPR